LIYQSSCLGISITEGLKPLSCDAHVVEMNNITKSEKNIVLYVDHHSLLESQRKKMLDRALVDPPVEVHEVVVSPKMVTHDVEAEERGSLLDDSGEFLLIFGFVGSML
jgi:hypothetical protein